MHLVKEYGKMLEGDGSDQTIMIGVIRVMGRWGLEGRCCGPHQVRAKHHHH